MKQKQRRRAGFLARLLAGLTTGGALLAFAAAWVRASGDLTPTPGAVALLGAAGLLGLVLGFSAARTPGMVIRAVICSAAAVGLVYAFYFYLLLPGRESYSFTAYGRDIEVLAPRWVGLACVAPYFWLVDGATL